MHPFVRGACKLCNPSFAKLARFAPSRDFSAPRNSARFVAHGALDQTRDALNECATRIESRAYQQSRVACAANNWRAQNVSRGCSRDKSPLDTRRRKASARAANNAQHGREKFSLFARRAQNYAFSRKNRRFRPPRNAPYVVHRPTASAGGAEIVLSRSIRAAAERGFDRLRRAQISRCRGAGNAQPKLRSATPARPKSLRRPPAAGAALVRRAPSCGGRSPAGDTSWPTYLSG